MLHPAAPIALLMVMLAAPGGIVAQYTAFAAEAEQDAAKLVAMLKTTFQDEAGERLGAGIVVGAKDDVLYIATANHNVRWGDARIANLRVYLNGDENKSLAGTVLPEFDAALDLAVVGVKGLSPSVVAAMEIPFERLGDVSSLGRGDTVTMLGHPNGHAWEMAIYPDRLSGVKEDRLLFQSTFIASGHSGGALLDENLDVVGLVRSDQPPYGEAVKIGKVLERVAAWGYPVQLGHDLRKPRFVQVAAASAHACALTANGEAYCFGSAMGGGALGNGTGDASDRFRRVLGGHRFRLVGVGRDHSCGLDVDGRAWCWGSNIFGELGNGTPEDAREETRVPVAVAGEHRFASLSVGRFHTCGLATDGGIWCWADLDRRIRAPRQIRSEVRLASVEAAEQDACGLSNAGQLYCWTLNSNKTDVPTEPTLSFATPAFRKFAMADDGHFNGCGLVGTTAQCWGDNVRGQLGDGRGGHETSAHDSDVPVPVSGTHAFEELSIGRYYGCGLARDGKAWCWGENTDGQLGDGTLMRRNAPVAVAGGLKFATLSAGIEMTCGVVVPGDVYCWGKVNDRVATEPTRIAVLGE
jgi:alpha-tubulin suppressor-like RCC1 family protein